jgi:hypothetical protein
VHKSKDKVHKSKDKVHKSKDKVHKRVRWILHVAVEIPPREVSRLEHTHTHTHIHIYTHTYSHPRTYPPYQHREPEANM